MHCGKRDAGAELPPDLEQIAENGRRFVKENFTFEKVVENWKRVLQEIA